MLASGLGFVLVYCMTLDFSRIDPLLADSNISGGCFRCKRCLRPYSHYSLFFCDSQAQIRVPIKDLTGLITSLVHETTTWEEVTKK